MFGSLRLWLGVPLLLFACVPLPCLATPQDIVINEVLVVPSTGNFKFVELYNRGVSTVNLGVWWTCDQPLQRYRRLLKIPSSGPDNGSGGIMIGPGDYVVIKSSSPTGQYMMQSNTEGTFTHFVNNGTSGLAVDDDNFSMWDWTTSPDAPDFNQVSQIRDYVAWASDGVYPGFRRGCNAFGNGLWPAPLGGECFPLIVEPVTSVAFVTTGMAPNSNLSINYNGYNGNDPNDYFLAPSTPGRRNVMPGDLDDDFDIDNNDATVFGGCFMQPIGSPPCLKADADANSNVDCIDWTQFLANWAAYSTLPAPSFVPCEGCLLGDFNTDGVVDGDDIHWATQFYVGAWLTPEAECANDYNTNGMQDPLDKLAFLVDLLGETLCKKGDFNNDGRVDGDDIDPMLNAYSNPAILSPVDFCRCDCNNDLSITPEDIDEFIGLLMQNLL